MTMSAAIAAKTMFNVEVKQEAIEIVRALNRAASLFGRISVSFSERLLQLPLPSSIRFKRAKAVLNKAVLRMIEERRRNKIDNGDLASLLLHAHEEGCAGRGMTSQEVQDEALTLFLTAFDTTSTALTWTWYLLSQHSAAESQIHEELDRVLQDRLPTAEDIPQLQFTRMVFAESLRMYPPSYIIPRQVLQDFQIDQYIVPRGTLILMSPYLIHHDSRFHANPEQFNPYNWDNHSKGQHSKYVYFPFSAGPRSCIGESFAWMEGILVLATIAQSWRIQLMPYYRLELLQLINLRPRGGMLMTVHQRK